MNRRDFLLGLAALALPRAALSSNETHLVNCIIFTCPECNAMKDGATAFEKSMGSLFRYAPLPSSAEAPMERAWYALRGLADPAEVRQIIYDIPHVMRIQNPSIDEVVEYLRLGRIDVDKLGLRSAMMSREVGAAIGRAALLMQKAGTVTVPAFIWVRGGRVIFAMERGTTPTSQFSAEVMKQHRTLVGERT